MSEYGVAFEVAGPVAMFARPDTGGTPTSYPVPTWSAAKGLFESIAFLADGAAWICPTTVEICRRIGESGGQIQYQRYTTKVDDALSLEVPSMLLDVWNSSITSGCIPRRLRRKIGR